MTPHEIVAGLVQQAPALIRRAYKRGDEPGSECTRMAWLARDVLRRFEVASEPVDTICSAWNARFADWLRSGVDHKDAFQHTNDPFVLLKLGVTEIIPTHLVVYVPATAQIIDLDCWQLARPSRGIQLPAAIALPWDGRQAQYETPTGFLEYRRWPPAVKLGTFVVKLLQDMESRHNMIFGNVELGFLSKAIARRIRERAGRHSDRASFRSQPTTDKGDSNAHD
jgi:hypothetical protein